MVNKLNRPTYFLKSILESNNSLIWGTQTAWNRTVKVCGIPNCGIPPWKPAPQALQAKITLIQNWPSQSIPCGWLCRRVSHHYLRCPKFQCMKLEETAPESHQHLLTSTVGGRQRGVGHDGIARSVNLRRRRVSIPGVARSVPHSCWCPGVNQWYEGYSTDLGTEPWRLDGERETEQREGKREVNRIKGR